MLALGFQRFAAPLSGIVDSVFGMKKSTQLWQRLALLVETPFFRYYRHRWRTFQNVPLGSVGAFVYENWAPRSAAFADYLFRFKLVSKFLSNQLIFPSSHRFFKTFTVRSNSSLRSLAMSKVSASLCSFK